MVRARNPTREGLCSPLQVLWPQESGRVLLFSSAGMTEKPSIILAGAASAQAKTEVFVKIDAVRRGSAPPNALAGPARLFRRKKTQAFELGFESTKGGRWRRHLEIDGGTCGRCGGLGRGLRFRTLARCLRRRSMIRIIPRVCPDAREICTAKCDFVLRNVIAPRPPRDYLLKINNLQNNRRCHPNDILEETLRFSKVIGIDTPNFTVPYTGKCKIRDHALVIANRQYKTQERTKWNAK
ncbi:hypothetical protein CBM2605_A60199 [Cupriavidus neocaledonicus]|uniref:Uncharacterized protein n=1 Tax=Cupriavidus neocaledonicus TaxID=1040979 RepID=A0ABY1V2N7_9BURK|nr:hypothetical protein CBM2605_A60199 [Cupriavidus neocaledonicus]